MVLYLAEHLNVPLRERNALLLASGHAPVYSHRALDDGGSDMRYVREAIERLLASHDPYPAFVIDRQWNVVARNASTAVLIKDVAPGAARPACERLAPGPLPVRAGTADELLDLFDRVFLLRIDGPAQEARLAAHDALHPPGRSQAGLAGDPGGPGRGRDADAQAGATALEGTAPTAVVADELLTLAAARLAPRRD